MRKKRETKYVTIKDVAKHADVSIATVSRVLNNGKVRPERKIRVLDAMKELNYMPNNSARNLASVNATKRVGLVVPSLSSFYTPFVEGFKSGLSLYKYESAMETFDNSPVVFEEICDRQERNAEVRGIVQFTTKRELINKTVVSLLETNDSIEYAVDEELKNAKIGLYFPTDENKSMFIENVVLSDCDTTVLTKDSDLAYDIIVTHYIDSAFELINRGYKGKIKTIEQSQNVSVAVPQISTLSLDMYGLGVYTSRFIIKQINEEEEVDSKFKTIIK